jgi:hypothetical protein
VTATTPTERTAAVNLFPRYRFIALATGQSHWASCDIPEVRDVSLPVEASTLAGVIRDTVPAQSRFEVARAAANLYEEAFWTGNAAATPCG